MRSMAWHYFDVKIFRDSNRVHGERCDSTFLDDSFCSECGWPIQIGLFHPSPFFALLFAFLARILRKPSAISRSSVPRRSRWRCSLSAPVSA